MLQVFLAVLAGIVVSQAATFSTTLYLHRCQTHQAFKLHPGLEIFFRFLLWITTGQKTKEWVAVHRKHHAHSDEIGDPHSPELEGFWKVQVFNWLLYVRETKRAGIIEKYARDIREGPWDRTVFNHGKFGPLLGTTLLCLTFGVPLGLLAAGVHTFIYVGVLTSCVNAIGHHRVWTGYQNYSRADASNTFNYRWLAYLTGGEGLHNNHHGQPKSAKFAHRRGEPDPSWPLIAWLGRRGLAYDIQMPR